MVLAIGGGLKLRTIRLPRSGPLFPPLPSMLWHWTQRSLAKSFSPRWESPGITGSTAARTPSERRTQIDPRRLIRRHSTAAMRSSRFSWARLTAISCALMRKIILLFAALCAGAYAQQPTAPAIPDNLLFEPDVAYAHADAQQMMDIVRPRDSGQVHPAVVCIHGGGFRAGSRKGYLAQCIRLAQRGYVAATVDYRLAPAAPFPAAVHDVKASVRYLRANAARLRIDPTHIGATGGSAGGH